MYKKLIAYFVGESGTMTLTTYEKQAEGCDMKDIKYIRKRFLKAKESADALRYRVRNKGLEHECQYSLSTDISNVSFDFEQIIESLLKIKST